MQRYGLAMRESEIERHLVWHVTRLGGVAYKFRSVTHRGVADRIVCLPGGQTWFIELKTKGGRLEPLQKLFAQEMERMGQRYACLWTKEQVDLWVKELQP
jgi:hypothetical protein